MVVHIIELILAGLVFLFCILFFFNYEKDGQTGLMAIVGNSSTNSNFKETDSDSVDTLTGVQTTEAPEVISNEKIFSMGDTIDVLSLISVRPAGDTVFYDGSEGADHGFTVTIRDITDDYGNSVPLGVLGSEDEAESLSVVALYDKDTCKIEFQTIGIFRVVVKVVGANGRFAVKEIRIPIELY